MTKWVIVCPHCGEDCYWSGKEPLRGEIPVARDWKYMNNAEVEVGSIPHCSSCKSSIYPLMIEYVEERND